MHPRNTPTQPTFTGVEVRRLGATGLDLEQRAGTRAAGELPHIVGYASVFDSPTIIGGGPGAFTEIIRAGAFARAIVEDDVRALFNHNEDHVLGRTASGTLTLSEDRHGLKMDITPPDTMFGRDVVKMVERGDITGASFGFQPVRQKWIPGADDAPATRELLEVRLFDVSPVTYPAYPDAEVSSRAIAWARRGMAGADLTEEELAMVGAWLSSRRALQRAGGGPLAAEAHGPQGRPAPQSGEDPYTLRLRGLEAIEASLASEAAGH